MTLFLAGCTGFAIGFVVGLAVSAVIIVLWEQEG